MTIIVVALLCAFGLYAALTRERTGPSPQSTGDPRAELRRPGGRLLDRIDSPTTMVLLYADADGVVTERTVTILAVEFDQDSGQALMLEAWCHMRQARRHFRPDRILEMFDVATGARIDRPSRHLVDWAKAQMRVKLHRDT